MTSASIFQRGGEEHAYFEMQTVGRGVLVSNACCDSLLLCATICESDLCGADRTDRRLHARYGDRQEAQHE